MFFPVVFTRTKGSSSTLGTDSAPTGPPAATADNVLTGPLMNAAGWPSHRVAVAYACSVASTTLPADLYFWEQNSQLWFRANQSRKRLVPGQVTFFDLVALSNQTPAGSGGASYQGVGGHAFALVVGDPGSDAVNGTYTFAMGLDVTTIGEDLPDVTSSATVLRAVTTSDTVDLPDGPCRALYFNAAGNVNVLAANDDPSATGQGPRILAVTASQTLAVSARRVYTSSTTPGLGIFAMYN